MSELLKHQKDIISLEAQIDAAELERVQHHQLVASLRDQIESSKYENERLAHNVEERDQDLASLRLANRELQCAVADSQQLLQSAVSERDSLLRNITSLQAELDASIDYAAEIQRSLAARDAEIDELKSRLDAQQLIFRDVAMQSSQSQSAANRLQAQLDACLQERLEHDGLVSSLKAEIDSSKRECGTHLLQIQNEKQRQLQLEDVVSTLTAELSMFRRSSLPIQEKNSASRHQKTISSGAENYDLMVVLAGQVDTLTAGLQRSRLHSLHLIGSLRSLSNVTDAFHSWKILSLSQKCNRLRWQTLTSSLRFKARSRAYTALTGKFTSDRLRRIQEQARALKSQLLDLMQEDETSPECNNSEQNNLQIQLEECRKERDSALIESEYACEVAATAKAEHLRDSELLLNIQLQVSHLMRELEQERQNVFHLSSLRDALKAELDQTCAALVSHQQLAACNSELHRMVASAEAVSVDTSSVLETVHHQLRAALSDAESSAAAKSTADRTCEAALRQVEQSTSMQMKQKERILELTSSLNETKSELQSILHRNNHTSQEVLDLKRSLASSVLQIADLQEASDKLRSKLMSQDAAIVASTQELSVKEEYIRALQKTLESLGKERRKLQLQVLLEKYIRFHFDLFSRCS